MESDAKSVPLVAHRSFANRLTQQTLGICGLKYKEPSPGESRGVGIEAGVWKAMAALAGPISRIVEKHTKEVEM